MTKETFLTLIKGTNCAITSDCLQISFSDKKICKKFLDKTIFLPLDDGIVVKKGYPTNGSLLIYVLFPEITKLTKVLQFIKDNNLKLNIKSCKDSIKYFEREKDELYGKIFKIDEKLDFFKQLV